MGSPEPGKPRNLRDYVLASEARQGHGSARWGSTFVAASFVELCPAETEPARWESYGARKRLFCLQSGRITGMKIAIGADHAGFELKEKIKQHLVEQGVQVEDQGTVSNESVDYPDFARKVGEQVAQKKADLGILVCGSGVGMAIAANKVPGVRAANVTTEYEAQMSREHNDANVLAIGSRILDEATAQAIVDKWLHTPFAGGRHQRRVDKISRIEREEIQAQKVS
jgi:ribose 5-phosphate isomerase B